MSQSFGLFGLDTLERISLGDEKSVALAWGLYDFAGPILDLVTLRASKESKLVYLPKDLLEKLYTRFALANPKGTRIVVSDEYVASHTPPGLSQEEFDRLFDEGKLFAEIPGDKARYPRLRELLPELNDPAVQERLLTDPAISLALMNRAYKEGVLSLEYGPRHKRWLPEWEAYAAAHKAAAEGST